MVLVQNLFQFCHLIIPKGWNGFLQSPQSMY